MSTLKVNNLQVGQDATASNNFTLYQPAVPDGTVRLGVGNSGSVSDLLTINDSSAKLKISTLTGTTGLNVIGLDSNGYADVEITSTGTSGSSRLYFSDTAGKAGSIIYTHSDNSLNFATNGGSTDIKIDSNGRVLHGTTYNAEWGAGLISHVPQSSTTIYFRPSGEYTASLGYVNNTNTTQFISVDSSYNRTSAVSAGIFLSAFHADLGGSGCGFTIKNLRSDAAGLTFSSVFTAGSGGNPAVEVERLRITSAGNVGIGTSNPLSALTIWNDVVHTGTTQGGGSSSNISVVDSGTIQADAGGSIAFSYLWNDPQAQLSNPPYIKAVKTSSATGNYGGGLAFGTRIHGGSQVERVRIVESGNVGIGTTNPTTKLQVEGGVYINNGSINVSKNIIEGTDNWLASSYRMDNYKTFTNGAYQNYFRFTRSSSTADNNRVGVLGGMLHIVYINDRSNSVHTTGYNCYPIVVRGRSSDTMSGTVGTAIADIDVVIGSDVQVRFISATTTTIDLQIYIYNSDGGGSEQLCHAWLDVGLSATHSDRSIIPSRL